MASSQNLLTFKPVLGRSESTGQLVVALQKVWGHANVPADIQSSFAVLPKGKAAKWKAGTVQEQNNGKLSISDGTDTFEVTDSQPAEEVADHLESDALERQLKRDLGATVPRLSDPADLREFVLNATRRLVSPHYPNAAVAGDDQNPALLVVSSDSSLPSHGDAAQAAQIGKKAPRRRKSGTAAKAKVWI